MKPRLDPEYGSNKSRGVGRGRIDDAHLVLIVLAMCVANSSRARAQDTMEPSLRGSDRVISLPYAFWNESFGAAAGYVYAVNGYPQPQAALLGTVMTGTTGSVMGLVMDRVTWIQERVGVEWIQLVAFAEGGRAAPEYRLDELHEDLRWDAGVGVRMWAKGLVGRVDVRTRTKAWEYR